MTIRLRDLLMTVVLATFVVAALTGCDQIRSAANVGPPTNESKNTAKGDISPRRLAQPSRSGGRSTKPTATPTVTLSPLPQPHETFVTPKLPAPPAKSDSELVQIAYQLKTVVWKSAGIVDPKTTKAHCSRSENEIIQVGSYKFTCNVTLWGSSTAFRVAAKVGASDVKWSWSAVKLPVSEKKAVYEATRQGFKPARVTCDIVKLELVEVGKPGGLTCWVTDVYNKSTPYRGELLPNGSLAFRPAS